MTIEPHAIEINGHKVKIGLRDLIYVIGIVITAAGTYFALKGDVSGNNRNISDLYDKNREIIARIEKMDENGTRRSHEVDYGQKQEIDANSEAIKEINRVLRDLGPKVDKIDANVLWLMGKQIERIK